MGKRLSCKPAQELRPRASTGRGSFRLEFGRKGGRVHIGRRSKRERQVDLVHILAGLESVDAGEVRVNGKLVTGVGEHFAYMPQRDLLFPWRRLTDNATIGLEIQGVKKADARERVRPLLLEFGLGGFESAYPSELSGGMKQRVALLRTVVQQRKVILLDEPFGALDYLTRTDLQLWLERVWRDHRWTVILVEHNVLEAILLSHRRRAWDEAYERPALR